MESINSFKNEYDFLSNFYEVNILYDGILYRSVEAAFQANKSISMEERMQFANFNPIIAKRMGRKIQLRDDWADIRIQIMKELIILKFVGTPTLKKKLLSTSNLPLIEGNKWHDNFWGNCTCPKCTSVEGKNNLGKIIMDVRDLIQNYLS